MKAAPVSLRVTASAETLDVAEWATRYVQLLAQLAERQQRVPEERPQQRVS